MDDKRTPAPVVPRIVEATGIAVASDVPGLAKHLEAAAVAEIEAALAEGVTDPEVIRNRTANARHGAKTRFLNPDIAAKLDSPVSDAVRRRTGAAFFFAAGRFFFRALRFIGGRRR